MPPSTLLVPNDVTITNVGTDTTSEAEFVICNEATGRYFLANLATTRFFTALKDGFSLQKAAVASGLQPVHAEPLLQQLLEHGLLVQPGEHHAKNAKVRAPLESRWIFLRWDLIDIGPAARRLAGLGRLAFSRSGMALWTIALLVMAFQLLTHREKIVLTLRQALDADWQQWTQMLLIFVAMKVVHEFGHAIAYREMCRKEGLDPGPVRAGICLFAFTPFPFTDVTGAWRLRSRWHRAAIGAGGVYFESWAMVALTLIWAQTQSGQFQTIILQVVIFAGSLTLLFNLNPLVRLDGYFVLTDLLRRPNLAARSGQAARSTAARALGADLPRAASGDLVYWCLSYLYRWTIFAGIFWMLYRFDPRLAPFALAIVVMTLLLRPLFNTLRFAWKAGARPLRLGIALLGLVGLAWAAVVPLPARLLVEGQMLTFETRFVQATEPGLLDGTSGRAPTLVNPPLAVQISDTRLQGEMLENLLRANFASARQQALLSAELEANTEALERLEKRRSQLALASAEIDDGARWTALAARRLEGAWVSPADADRLGALSRPVPPHFRLHLPEQRIPRDNVLGQGTSIRVRFVSDPDCEIGAKLANDPANAIASQGNVLLFARPQAAPNCLREMAHGSAVVARLPLGPISLVDRVRLGAARMLQDRLQLETW